MGNPAKNRLYCNIFLPGYRQVKTKLTNLLLLLQSIADFGWRYPILSCIIYLQLTRNTPSLELLSLGKNEGSGEQGAELCCSGSFQ